MTDENPRPTLDFVRGKLVRGSMWTVGMRWCVRGMGVISTIILVRVLEPGDFGIIAMAMVAVGLLDAVTNMQIGDALISQRQDTTAEFNSAWTIQLIRGAVLSVCLFVAAPWVAAYFNEPRAVTAIRFLALLPAIEGFENIGTVTFRKNLNLAKDFRFAVYKRLVIFSVTIISAFLLKNYWALIIGMLVGKATGVYLSFAMHPFRPGFSLHSCSRILSFSQWMFAIGLGDFLNKKLDQIVVGGVSGTAGLGVYHVGSEVSSMASGEVVLPIAHRTLYPGLVKLKDDPIAFRRLFLESQAALATLCLPAGFGLAAVADQFVLVVLGDKWGMASPIIAWLSIASALAVLSDWSARAALMATGRLKQCAILNWLRPAALVPVLFFAGHLWGINTVAAARMGVAVAMFPVIYVFLCSSLAVPKAAMLKVLWRPCLASILMFAFVKWLDFGSIENVVVLLGVEIVAGASVFTVTMFLFWASVGRPAGLERHLVNWIVALLSRRKAAPLP